MYDFSRIKVVSFNVNGLRSEQKRRSIFNYLKYFKADIILLQETHSTCEDETVWTNEWGAKVIFNHGTNFSKGVAVLFQRGLPFKTDIIWRDLDGRYIVLEINLNDFKFVIANIYGPNQDRPEFFINLFDTIEKRENDSMLLGGDFNASLNPEMDLYNHSGSMHVKKREVINEYMELKDLRDVWRLKHPQDKVFTWRKPNVNQLIMSRLDYFLVSQDLFLRTNKIEICTKYISDHSRVVLELDLSQTKRGKGFWKFNNLLLKDKIFLDKMNETIQRFKYNVKNREQSLPHNQWEALKLKMVETAKNFAKNKAKEKNLLIEKLENRILLLDKQLPTEQDLQKQEIIRTKIRQTEEFLLNEHEEKVKAACFRSKATYYLEGEKNSKYFFNLERHRGNSRTLSTLIRSDGSIIKDPKLMLKEEKIFYEKLYNSKVPKGWPYINVDSPKLDEDEKKELEKDISEIELSNSLMGMSNSKTPGNDGISADFYKVFWKDLKSLYTETTNFVLKRGLLHYSARQGIITLLPKKDKDLMYLNNWRPLTLLNVDYKIISRAIALRIKSKVSNLVSEDQTGFIQGHDISETLRTIIDIIQIANNRSLDLVVASLDWQKCFDKISFVAIDKAFQYFNFGPIFRQMVQTLLTESVSCVLNNGYCTEYFEISSGVKQGSNSSPLLWVILAEILAIQIRKNTNIRGC